MVLDTVVPGDNQAVEICLRLDVESVADDGRRAHGLNKDPISARQQKSSLGDHVRIVVNLDEPCTLTLLYVGFGASV